LNSVRTLLMPSHVVAFCLQYRSILYVAAKVIIPYRRMKQVPP